MKKVAAVKPADVTAYAKNNLIDDHRTTLVFEAPAPAGGAQ